MKIMCGIACRLRKRNSALTVTARSTSGSQTMTTTSATSIACCASYNSSTLPGQSRIVQGSSRKVVLATLISVDIWRARASAAWSPTELPSRTLPCRLVVPLANSIPSSKLVLPDRYGPTSATQRGALGIEDPPQSGHGRHRGPAALSGPDRGARLALAAFRQAPRRHERHEVLFGTAGLWPAIHSMRGGRPRSYAVLFF